MLNEEPAQSQDLQMMGMLLPLGIEKGKDFKPDVATVARLNSAAAEAHAWLYDCAASRRYLFEQQPFAMKLILTKRPKWKDADHTASPRHNFAWYLWDYRHSGAPVLGWLP
jgi:hypothetical protein